MLRRRRNSEQRQGGFTLIEVLVALAVLALSLGAVYSLFSTGLTVADRGEDEVVATALAQSQLETLGTAEPLALGETAGRFANGFRWRRTVRAYRGALALARYDVVVPYAVDVEVSWAGGRRAGSVTLSTVQLRPRAEGRAP